MQWFSPYGWGFPGWHIECSVMARADLGDTIDLHSGGEDNKFPHHECEIAQSEALTGVPFSRSWVHTKFLLVEGEKMSKSKGNFHTVRDLVKNGADPLAIRLALMGTSFTKELNFTAEGLAGAERAIRRLREAREKLGDRDDDGLADALDGLVDAALGAMADNLNTSVAVAKALEGAKAIAAATLAGPAARRFLDDVEGLLGICPAVAPAPAAPEPSADDRILGLIDERNAARKAKNFARADEIRQLLADEGVVLIDTPDGTRFERARPAAE